ncbi:hypothetical protein DL96DRAFT_1192990 [Flagelloscypha sp. PMI_526]|nr:hypothetical protein DL96DRAFT_1192990 [Flagelloscypha sp. PMI_526]
MASKQSFIFVSKDILNSGLRHISGNIPLYTQTETGWFNRKQTTVLYRAAGDQGGDPTVLGIIDWKKEEIEVYGQRRKISDICFKPGMLLSKTREWTWEPQAKTFLVEWENDTWVMTTKSKAFHEGTFNPYASHWFGKDEAATLELSPNTDPFHVAFMILILCYMEGNRLANRKTAGNVALMSVSGIPMQ